ncbi:unnamed protein product, partial [Ectocarpus sp. 12 AP-2014]
MSAPVVGCTALHPTTRPRLPSSLNIPQQTTHAVFMETPQRACKHCWSMLYVIAVHLPPTLLPPRARHKDWRCAWCASSRRGGRQAHPVSGQEQEYIHTHLI